MDYFRNYKVLRAPPSVYYVPNFITSAEEGQLWQGVYSAPKPKWKELSKRRLQNWGGLPHDRGMVAEPLPRWLSKWTSHLRSLGVCGSLPLNHVLVNEYKPGQGIMAHEDGPLFHPSVCTINTGCHTLLNLYRSKELTTPLLDRFLGSLLLECGSLLVLQDSAYTATLHGIAETTWDIVNRDRVLNWSSTALGMNSVTIMTALDRLNLVVEYPLHDQVETHSVSAGELRSTDEFDINSVVQDVGDEPDQISNKDNVTENVVGDKVDTRSTNDPKIEKLVIQGTSTKENRSIVKADNLDIMRVDGEPYFIPGHPNYELELKLLYLNGAKTISEATLSIKPDIDSFRQSSLETLEQPAKQSEVSSSLSSILELAGLTGSGSCYNRSSEVRRSSEVSDHSLSTGGSDSLANLAGTGGSETPTQGGTGLSECSANKSAPLLGVHFAGDIGACFQLRRGTRVSHTIRSLHVHSKKKKRERSW